MIATRRAHELIDLHARLRKEAYEAVAPHVASRFAAGAERVQGAKVADVAREHPAILQHHLTP